MVYSFFRLYRAGFRYNVGFMIAYGFAAGSLCFANPAMAEAFKIMGEIGQDAMTFFGELLQFEKEIEEMGFVQQIAALTAPAFDLHSNFLRGTLGTMTDILLQPENLLKAVEGFSHASLEAALAKAPLSNGRVVLITLQKGMDNFLSDEQYKKFYWDTLLRLINGLIDNGLTPWVYTEGPYQSRIECLMDLPKGRCWIHFEHADMKKAKKLLGNVACLSGGISSQVLMFGTKEEVIDSVKENMDILAPGGGYIFDLGDSMEDCKPENVEAMFETVRTYGKY